MERGSEYGLALERRLLRVVSDLLKRMDLVYCPNPLIVAVSGGPDSLALLLLLNELRSSLGLNLHVAHLNHGLRGNEAHEDAVFVENMADRLSLPVTSEIADVESYKIGLHLSPEDAARELRYGFLSRVAIAEEAAAVVLGHTADDQAETILMHLLRGSGLNGLIGMSISSHWFSSKHNQSIVLIRPLLDVKREATEAMCLWKGVTPRYDSSNSSMQFTRNRIRSELIPMLKSYNPRIQEALRRLGCSVAQNQTYMKEEVAQARKRLGADLDGGIGIEKAAFISLSPIVKRHLLKHVYEEITRSSNGLKHSHLENMVTLAHGGAGKEMELPGGLVFSVGYDYVRLGIHINKSLDYHRVVGEYQLAVPGDVQIPGWAIKARLSTRSIPSTAMGRYAIQLNRENIGEFLSVRGRRPGDRFHPLGMSGSKKLQDFMVDEKVPRDMRDRVPLVLSDQKIVWVVGHRIAHWVRLMEDTTEVVELEFSPV